MPSKCARMLRSSAVTKLSDEMQTPIEPGKQFVLDLVVNRERDLACSLTESAEKSTMPMRAIFPPTDSNAYWSGEVALDRQEDRMRLKAEAGRES